MQDFLVIDARHDAFDEDEWATEQHAVVLDELDRFFDESSDVLSLRFVIRRLDLRILLVQKSVARAEGERHRDEEENHVSQKHGLPQSVRLASRLLLGLQLRKFAAQVPNRDATVNDTEDAKAVKN